MFRIIGFFLLGMMPLASAWAAPGDAAVRQAQQAFAARKLADLQRAARDVPADHVLTPYVEFWRLMLESRSEDARIADFLARYPGSRLAEALRADWLKSLGAREAWPLWFTGRDLPSACTPLFERLAAAGLIGQEDAWRRLRLALEASNPGVARVAANLLPEAQRPALALLDQASRDPARLLNAGTLDLGRRGDREIALYALDQLAKNSGAQAEQALRRLAPQFSQEDLRTAWARLATWAARRHEPVALSWFQQAGAVALSDFQREWWARAALRAGDWQAVQGAIASMGDATRAQPVWRYWRARALQASGRRDAATPVFLELSREHHYYGQLAQEELGPVMRAPVNTKTASDDVAAVARQPGIARALALYQLGLRGDAGLEWNWAIQAFSDAQLLAAAELARRMEWYDRAISTAERTRELH